MERGEKQTVDGRGGFWKWWYTPHGPILFSIAIGLAVGIITAAVRQDAVMATLLTISAMSLTLTLRVVQEILREPREGEKILRYDTQAGALEKASALQRGAGHVTAVWAAMNYDEALAGYYQETMSPAQSTKRVIDLALPPDAILDHLQRHWELIRARKYEVTFYCDIDFEALVARGPGAARHAGIFLFGGHGTGWLVVEGAAELADCVTRMISFVEERSLRLSDDIVGQGYDEDSVREELSFLKASLEGV